MGGKRLGTNVDGKVDVGINELKAKVHTELEFLAAAVGQNRVDERHASDLDEKIQRK